MCRCRGFAVIVLSLLLAALFASCGSSETARVEETGRIELVTTLFPQYDFARIVGGDKANVTLLLSPGLDCHAFEPSPEDLFKIYKSDIFIYTSDFLEPWAAGIAESTECRARIVDLSKGILDDEGHEDTEEHVHSEIGVDSHIWLDLTNAEMMVEKICAALVDVDFENKDYYEENAENLKGELSLLDAEIIRLSEKSSDKTIVFGSPFAYYHFINRYGFNYESVYDSCGEENEPSVLRIIEITEFVKDNKIPYIFYEEFSDPKIARSICEETSAELKLFSTIHNVTLQQIEENLSFVNLMRQNIANLEEGLK